MRRLPLTFLFATLLSLAPPAAHAQNGDALRVFLDCQSMHCDFDHFRREIGFVNWVRDREVAEIHVLGTAEGTGGGGRVFTLTFIGRDRFAGRVDTLQFIRNATDTFAEEREGLTRTLALGLVPFVAGTPLSDRITISYDLPGDEEAPAGPVDDPWDYWVFSTNVSGSIRGEERFKNYSGSGRFTASRTTEALKVFLHVRGSYRRSETVLDSLDDAGDVAIDPVTGDSLTRTFVDERTNYGLFTQAVWSLGPHWSVGGRSNLGSSTFSNEDFSLEAGPAVEFSFFPYSESSRRSVTVQYSVGVAYFDWEEVTIFGKAREARPRHTLEFDVEAQQPWGSVGGSIEADQFLDDLAKHRVEISGGVGIRLFRGLRFNVSGSFTRVKDQINLAAGGLSQEDILVQRRELGTEFEYRANVGFSYLFGSIYNNIVNTRF